MNAHDERCCRAAANRRSWTAATTIFAVLAALMPKCPICIGAWLGVLGLAGLAARCDPRALWFAMALVVAVAGAFLVHRVFDRKETRS